MNSDWSDDEDVKQIVSCMYLAYAIGSIFLCGWIVSLIWNWHIAPLGLPLISKRTAIGMGMLWGAIAHRPSKRTPTPREQFALILNGLVADFWYLGIAWIAQVTK